ncbi:hypothetical protein DFH08DRAFT_819838 [Mycena albidolilacea]|uniref:Uncharacterized protein n=1 Tax=Mycena albidolilacea TaxID=1033008 RepID=A0AAD6ZE15_9AGAR|nr:hypothetical protein DFH08DRAFT_819838 [Mycena albidolilacea]
MPQQITTLKYSETLNAILETVATLRQYVVDLDWESIKEGARSLDFKATTSQIIAISYQDNATAIQVATNAFGSAGVLLDVITACLNLLGSTILRQHIVIVENHAESIDTDSLVGKSKIR